MDAIVQELTDLADDYADPAGEAIDAVGSFYALALPTSTGPLHVLLRLEDGDIDNPEFEVFYLNGVRVDDPSRRAAAEKAARAALEANGEFLVG
jgi:hypothetical protein